MLLLLAQSIIIICNDAQVYDPTASCFVRKIAQSKSHVSSDVNYVLYRKAEIYQRWIPVTWTTLVDQVHGPHRGPPVHGLPPVDHP